MYFLMEMNEEPWTGYDFYAFTFTLYTRFEGVISVFSQIRGLEAQVRVTVFSAVEELSPPPW